MEQKPPPAESDVTHHFKLFAQLKSALFLCKTKPLFGIPFLLGLVAIIGLGAFNQVIPLFDWLKGREPSPAPIGHIMPSPSQPPAKTARPTDAPGLARAADAPGSGPAGAVEIATARPEEWRTVIFYIPTLFRDAEILVDGRPAEVTEPQLSRISVRVPVKNSPTIFEFRHAQLTKPKIFKLLISHDRFEYSPFS